MVTRIKLPAVLVVGLLMTVRLTAADIPAYRVGDVATNDVVTPIPLVVTDPVATALLKEKEQREIRYIVRYAPSLVEECERAFRSHMALLREEFIKELSEAYGRSKVDKSVERTPKFLELTSRFREEHQGNPKLFLYMPYWAQGRSDEHLLMDWIGYMRRAMDTPVRADVLPKQNVGTTVQMITVPDFEVDVQLEHAERYGVLTPLNNIIPLSQARQKMESEFPEADAYIAKFLGPFLKPNCVFDEDLTRLARETRVESRIVAVNYAAGDAIVRVGQVVDARVVAALEELRKRAPEATAPNGAAAIPVVPSSGLALNPWLIGGVCGVVLAVLATWMFARVRSATGTRSPATSHGLAPSLPARARDAGEVEGAYSGRLTRLEGESEREWRERALAAERRAERARELARSNVASALKDKVVEHLSTQRDDLLDHQQSAAEQMAGLEARLQRIQGPLSERLRAYEQRIAELEEELALKDEENRALIRAKIQNLREQMAREKAGRAFDLN